MNIGHIRLLVGEPMLLIHTQRTIAHCQLRRGNCQYLERTNENDGFKMTALEIFNDE